MIESDAQPRGSAGIANQAAQSTVNEVAEEYGRIVEQARDAALGRQQTDLFPPAESGHRVEPGVSTARPDMHDDAR